MERVATPLIKTHLRKHVPKSGKFPLDHVSFLHAQREAWQSWCFWYACRVGWTSCHWLRKLREEREVSRKNLFPLLHCSICDVFPPRHSRHGGVVRSLLSHGSMPHSVLLLPLLRATGPRMHEDLIKLPYTQSTNRWHHTLTFQNDMQ